MNKLFITIFLICSLFFAGSCNIIPKKAPDLNTTITKKVADVEVKETSVAELMISQKISIGSQVLSLSLLTLRKK